jgi:signal transduction histidine kinase
MSNAFSMFKSATLKLTVWYVLILISISLLFSVVIFTTATSEVGTRINYLQRSVRPAYNSDPIRFNDMRDYQVRVAQSNLIGSLVITNICIWIAGGFGSYYLARRTLRPIEEAHEAQSRFTSDASHELRTPLASMKIELEVALRDHTLSKPEMRELLVSNLEEVNKLTKLSHTLLQLSRLDHKNIEREKVELNAIANEVIDRFDKTRSRIQLSGPKPLYAYANRLNVEELLTILVDNALKYSPAKSTIDVKMISTKQTAGFEVANSGEGIAEDILPHIFDRFYRADTSRTSGETKGYGLGLSLAKKIVELHGGELSVSSAPQATTTFHVSLPKLNKNQA